VSASARVRNEWLKALVAVRFRRFGAKIAGLRAAEAAARHRATHDHGRALGLPRSVVIRVTERCFLRCRMCGQNGDRGRFKGVPPSRRPVFRAEALERIIDEMGRWPMKPFLKLTGGEPLVEREMTVAALERASSLGIVTKLSSNGVVLADERVARRIALSGLDHLSISLDGPPDVHDRLRGRKGTYGAALEGIRNIGRYAREARGRRPMILVSAVVSALNQDRLLDLARGLAAANIDWLNIQFMHFTTAELTDSTRSAMTELFGGVEAPWGAFANEELAAGVDAGALAREIAAIRRERLPFPVSFLGIGDLSAGNIEAYYHRIEDPLKDDLCALPYSTAFLVPPSRMVMCIDNPFLYYADLAEMTLTAGWREGKANAFRRALAGHYGREKANFPQCRRCNWRFN
jgi:Fe-coproporphyrin III synthase